MLEPVKILKELGIEKGMIVADFGSGAGYFSVESAKLVGDLGKVYALDIVEASLGSVRSLAEIHNVSNIETRWTNLEKTSSLDTESCDISIVVNIIFQIEEKDRKSFLAEVIRTTKREGKILFLDWRKSSIIGPPREGRISKEELIGLLDKNIKFIKEIEVGENHWALVFEKV